MTKFLGRSPALDQARMVVAALFVLGLGIVGLACIEASPRWIFVGSDRRAYIRSDAIPEATMFSIEADDTTTIGLDARIFTVVRDSKRSLRVSCLYTLNVRETSRQIAIHGERAILTLRGTRLVLDRYLSSEPGRKLTGRADGIVFHYTVPSDLTFLPFPLDTATQTTISATLDSVIWVDNVPLTVPKITMTVRSLGEEKN